ncbi:MAG: CPBP family intramembrane metalloprotease [Acidobacteria bacterium]|nr:CPBP family intramembrane metalloprotease [Acidobacteriota bacterium]
MSGKSELFSPLQSTSGAREPGRLRGGWFKHRRSLLEIVLVFGLILVAVWTPQGRLNSLVSIVAAACVVGLSSAGEWTPSQLGLTRPLAGAGHILLVGVLLSVTIMLIGIPLRFAGAGYGLPWSRSWQYAIWSLSQEFILQSIFFVRFESMLGSRRAVIAAAALFAVAHLPSPLLTLVALAGGIVFAELFRRWRNLFPLGIIHAALGLTIAASLPDRWLHHMRVGIGYLKIHP